MIFKYVLTLVILVSLLLSCEQRDQKTIQLGQFEIQSQNLSTDTFRNGDKIKHVMQNEEWQMNSSPAYCLYDNADSNRTFDC